MSETKKISTADTNSKAAINVDVKISKESIEDEFGADFDDTGDAGDVYANDSDVYANDDELTPAQIAANKAANAKRIADMNAAIKKNLELISSDDEEECCGLCCSTGEEVDLFKCNMCEYISCIDCHKRQIFSSMMEAHCVQCRNYFTLEFMRKVFTKSFITSEYSDHRKRILYESFTERIRPIYAAFSEKYLVLQPNLKKLEEFDKELANKIRIYEHHILYKPELDHELLSVETWCNRNSEQCFHTYSMKSLVEYRTRVRNRISNIKLRLETIRHHDGRNGAQKDDGPVVEVVKCFSKDCPATLNSEGYCNMCEKTYCTRCEEIQGEDHKCNPETVKSVRFINKDTKPCPKCGVKIHRTYGCNHMFCTHCNTPFDWASLKILSTIGFHNPHFDQLLNQGRIAIEARPMIDANGCVEGYPWYTIQGRIRNREAKLTAKKRLEEEGAMTHARSKMNKYLRFVYSTDANKEDPDHKFETIQDCYVFIQNFLNRKVHLQTPRVLESYQPKDNVYKHRKEIDMFVKMIVDKHPPHLVKTELLKFENTNNKKREIMYAFDLFFRQIDTASIQIHDLIAGRPDREGQEDREDREGQPAQPSEDRLTFENMMEIVNSLEVTVRCVNEMFKNISHIHGGVVPYIWWKSMLVQNCRYTNGKIEITSTDKHINPQARV
jgi:hypothetical protein